jgi:hypothetical protein
MNAKKIFVVLLVAAVSATAVFARGTSDNAPPAAGPGPRGWNGPDFSDQKKVELSGTLSLKDWHPVLKTDKEEIVLMVPGIYRSDIEVKEGDAVKAEGYLIEDHPRWGDNDQKALFVTKAVINGKEYEIDERGWGPMAMGPGGRGMMGRSWGRPYGGMRGPGMMGQNWGPGYGPRGAWR